MAHVPINLGGGGINSSDVSLPKAMLPAGYKALTADSNDEVISDGGMAVNGPVSSELSCGQSLTVAAGYTPGGIVTAKSLAAQTAGTASAADIKKGKTAVVGGITLVGTAELMSALSFQ